MQPVKTSSIADLLLQLEGPDFYLAGAERDKAKTRLLEWDRNNVAAAAKTDVIEEIVLALLAHRTLRRDRDEWAPLLAGIRDKYTPVVPKSPDWVANWKEGELSPNGSYCKPAPCGCTPDCVEMCELHQHEYEAACVRASRDPVPQPQGEEVIVTPVLQEET